MNCELTIRSRRILLPDGFLDGVLNISDGKIISFNPGESTMQSDNTIDAGNDVVMPGIIDAHVHINEPGRKEWEGFETATLAAAAGGITTMIDMPLNCSPVTTNFANLMAKVEIANNFNHINLGFYGGVVPGNLFELEKLLQGGVFGLKTFLTHSGIDEFPNTTPAELYDVLQLLKKYDRPLLVHCELSEDHDGLRNLHDNPTSYQAYLASRPKSWEDSAIEVMIELCRATRGHVHIVHLSSADSLEQIRKAREEKLPLTVETAPHYLFFAAEEIKDKNTLLKCAPPIREKHNNEILWQGLKKGTIDFIASDHSPAPPEMKELESGNFEKAWGGIAGLQFSLPVIWTGGKRLNNTLHEVSKWMSQNPARFLNLDNRKGKIIKGYDADIVIWNPEKEIIIKEENIYHRHKQTPYAGLKLRGEVHQTIVNGNIVYNNKNFVESNKGNILFQN